MTATESHLSQYGISIQQANTFIMSNLSNLKMVFDTCKTYGVNNDMIAEIYGHGVNGTNVKEFFNSNGFTGSELDLIPVTAGVDNSLSFNKDWLTGKTFYQVILDTQDDNKNGSVSDHIVIAMKYENLTRLIDFKVSDGIDNFINTGSYSITNGALKVNDNDGDWEADKMVSIDATKMTTASSYSWNQPSQTTNWYFDINDAWLTQLGETKMFSEDFLASVGVTYAIFKDNNQWTSQSILFSNGKVYEAAGLNSGNSLTLTGTYTIMTDGNMTESRSSNGDVWQNNILTATSSYITIYDPATPNWSNDLVYQFLDLGKAQIALQQLQINGVISGDLSLI